MRHLQFVATVAILCTTFISAYSQNTPDRIYYVQLGAHQSPEAARSQVGEYIAAGFSPVVTMETSGNYSYRVRWGNFDTLAEARAWRTYAAEKLPVDAYIVWIDDDGRQRFMNEMPVSLPFSQEFTQSLTSNITYRTDYESAPAIPPEAAILIDTTGTLQLDADEMLLRGGYARTLDEGIAILEEGVQRYGDTDRGNDLRLRLVRKHMARSNNERIATLLADVRRTGTAGERGRADILEAYMANSLANRDDARTRFENCTQNTALEIKYRLDAAMRVAAILHTQYKLNESLIAYKQIEISNAPMNVRAFCAMQRMGIEMELAGREKGLYEECIRTADEIVAAFPEAPPQILATTRLMQLECFYWLKDYKKAVDLARTLQRDLPDEFREVQAAMYWEAVGLAKMGDYEAAMPILLVLWETGDSKDLPDRMRFAGVDQKIEAARWIAAIHQKNREFREADPYIDYLKARGEGVYKNVK